MEIKNQEFNALNYKAHEYTQVCVCTASVLWVYCQCTASVLRVYCECQPTELCIRSTKLSENRVDKISTRQGGMKLQ